MPQKKAKSGYFVDHKKGEIAELKKLLRDPKVNKNLESSYEYII